MYLQRIVFCFLLLFICCIELEVCAKRTTAPPDAFVQQLQGRLLSITVSNTSSLPSAFSFYGKYKTPAQGSESILRKTAIEVKRSMFLYGPPIAGGPYFPAGLGGSSKVATDIYALQQDLLPELANVAADTSKLILEDPNSDNLNTIEGYAHLYSNNLKHTLPRGTDAGGLSNYTQDLFFSMERLSNSPYALRRLRPSSDELSFHIDDATVRKISGHTLNELFKAGRLFYVDYRDQGTLSASIRYSAACDAYFFVSAESGDLLPLAIRTNVGSNLIYSPEDSANDWLLAKIMFNVNDFWFSQWNHLASTHEVVQIVYMAAIRTISEEHPVLALLHRLMYEVFAIQPLAATILFSPGGVVDELFPFSGQAAQDYVTQCYQKKGGGRFAANYFMTDLESRGLINSDLGPSLSQFPFYEDARTIFYAIEEFMVSFVEAYYTSDTAITRDQELQSWVAEARGPAKAIDFPDISSRESLASVLTHMAHLVSVAHHTSNTNELLEISSLLPFHPAALYAKPPDSKGIDSIIAFLPPMDKVAAQLAVGGLFARPKLIGSNRTIIHMFDDPNMLGRMKSQITAAAQRFRLDMLALSSVIRVRTFDANGLSQGMPFVWRALDPDVAPYSITT